MRNLRMFKDLCLFKPMRLVGIGTEDGCGCGTGGGGESDSEKKIFERREGGELVAESDGDEGIQILGAARRCAAQGTNVYSPNTCFSVGKGLSLEEFRQAVGNYISEVLGGFIDDDIVAAVNETLAVKSAWRGADRRMRGKRKSVAMLLDQGEVMSVTDRVLREGIPLELARFSGGSVCAEAMRRAVREILGGLIKRDECKGKEA